MLPDREVLQTALTYTTQTQTDKHRHILVLSKSTTVFLERTVVSQTNRDSALARETFDMDGHISTAAAVKGLQLRHIYLCNYFCRHNPNFSQRHPPAIKYMNYCCNNIMITLRYNHSTIPNSFL